jgi:hypothetical protein
MPEARQRKPSPIGLGFLDAGSHSVNARFLESLLQGLQGLGYVDGKHSGGDPLGRSSGATLSAAPRRDSRGNPPGELPVEQPTVCEPIVNLGTARALDINVSHAVLISADEVIR